MVWWLLHVLVVGFIDANKGGSQPKEILICSCWQRSHILGLQGLAEELQNRGHKVIFTTTEQDQHLVSSTNVGVEWLNAGKPPNTDEFYNWANTIADLWQGESDYARVMYDQLLPILKTRKIDLIIFEPLSLVGEALGKALNVTTVQVSPCLSTLARLGVDSIFYPEIISGLSYTKMTTFQVLQNSLISLVARYGLPLLRYSLQKDFRDYAQLPPLFLESQNPYGVSRLLIVANPFGFEIPRPTPPLVQFTGPLLPRSYRQLSQSLAVFFDSIPGGTPLVFISIGTNSVYTKESANAICEAIASLSENGVSVVWSIKEQHQQLIGAKIEELRQRKNVRIEPFVEQLAVLAHPSTKAFLSHCGMGSTNEALYYGVPLICMPMMIESDQPTNAGRIEELGLGTWIDRRKGEPTPIQVVQQVQTVLSSSQIREKSQHFQKIYKKLEGRQRAADLIELALEGYPALLQQDQTPTRKIDVYVALLVISICFFLMLRAIWGSCCKGTPLHDESKDQPKQKQL